MSKTMIKPKVTLEISKELFNGDSVHLFIEDREIEINGTVGERWIQSLLAGYIINSHLGLWEVSDEQIVNLKEQLAEVVKPKSIEESGKMLFTDTVSTTRYKRLKAVIIFRNTIFQINHITIFKKEDGSNSIVFGTV